MTVVLNARMSDLGPVTAHGRTDGLVVKAGAPTKYSIRGEAAIR
jgi:hypothetical protein